MDEKDTATPTVTLPLAARRNLASKRTTGAAQVKRLSKA